MKSSYSIYIKSVLSVILILIFVSIAMPLQGSNVAAQELQPTPTETEAAAAPVDVPVEIETQVTAPATETPVVLETQTTDAATEIPSAGETQTAAPLTEIPALLETPTAAVPLAPLPSEAPANPLIPREMPTQPALQQPDSNILQPQTNALLLAGDVQAKAIAAGGWHTCAVTSGDGVKCWGYNRDGELGNNSTTGSHVPVEIKYLYTDTVLQPIAAGMYHTCAVTSSGNVNCWGDNEWGQLGNNSTTNSLVPVEVKYKWWVQGIAAGYVHTCALTVSPDGVGVICWGYNKYGQLGNNSTTTSLVPVDVDGLHSGVQAITTGNMHTCALTTTGGIKCWGQNGYGQLGNNSTTQSNVPVDVSGLSSGVQAIAAGGNHTCALTTGGGVKCWGYNGYGQLGNNSTTDSHMPIDVSGLTSGVQAIAAGGNHTCAVTTGGGVKCWGYNGYGQLGNNSTTKSLVPIDVFGLSSAVQAIATGMNHSCAVTTWGGVKCWGYNGYGQLGNNSTRDFHVPIDVVGFSLGFSSQFNGSMAGWNKVSGVGWKVNNSTLFSLDLGRNKYASAVYSPSSFSNLDYSVRVMRSGCNTCATSIYVRGTGVSAFGNWTNGYQFSITRSGKYLVAKNAIARLVPIKNWKASSAIVKGSGWNVLRVVAIGSSLKFYINGTLVWSGTNSAFSSGKVGIGFSSNGTGGVNRLTADYATMSSTVMGVSQALQLAP